MTEGILQEEAGSFVKIIKSDLSELDVEAQYLQNVIGSDDALPAALKSSDSEAAGRLFGTYSFDESSFAAFYAEDGTQFYATENFPQNASPSSVTDGLNADSERMYYCYLTKVDGAGSFIVGYDLRSYDYLDPIREKTGGQFTVFNSDIRYATTIIGDDGNRIEGSEMSAEIAERVLQNGQTSLGSLLRRRYRLCQRVLRSRRRTQSRWNPWWRYSGAQSR